MFFFRYLIKKNDSQIKLQTFLRAKVFITNIVRPHFCFIIKAGKRMSLFPFPGYRAGMAVEASLILPFFLFFIMNILFALDMLRLHGNLAAALHQTGNQMAFAGYAYKNMEEKGIALPEEVSSVIMSEGYVRGRVIDILGAGYLNHTCLSSGTAGLHFVKSSVMKDGDRINLVASYKVRPFIRVLGFPEFSMENRYYGRAWTGYDVTYGMGDDEGEERMVFIAETGSVYHMERSCTYLCPSVGMISTVDKNDVRNKNGAKYYACERCGGDGLQAALYITEDGRRYHNTLRCSGLKRTIYTIRLSEAGDKMACTKCSSY